MTFNRMQTGHPADGVYFGLMSGTSMDGVDGVAVRFEAGKPPAVRAEVQPRGCPSRRNSHARSARKHAYIGSFIGVIASVLEFR